MSQYILVLQIGTYCDHYLTNYILSGLRDNYKLIFISNKKVFLDPNDINIYHNLSNKILELGSELVTGFSENSILYSLSNPYLISIILTDFININKLLKKNIEKYKPIKIIAHCGNVKDLIFLDRLDIPTYILYFCPGFLPNKSIPFVFHNYLKSRNCSIFDDKKSEINEDLYSKYYQSIATLCQLHGKFINIDQCFKTIQKMRHLLFFDKILIPKIKYTIPLQVKHFNFIEYKPSSKNLPIKIINWIKGKKNLIFVSFGSYSKNILSKNNYFIPRLKLFLKKYNYYAIMQVHKNYIYQISKYILFYKKFINYHKIVPKCRLVIFTGSIGLQSVCWRFHQRMLYMPFLTEQFFWAKLHKYHTGIDYIDYKDSDEIKFFLNKILNSLKVKIKFYTNFKKFSPEIPILVKNYIEN